MADDLILDRYRLIERLAVGGSAEVWRAHDEQLDRPVAVKRLHPHLLPDSASRKRLAAEARAAAGVSHPAIVGVYDVDAEGGVPVLVMELVEGESLAARIERDGPLPAREAVAIVAEIADALFEAHKQGVIHRDVKPGNVLLGRDGRTRLVDFGIAQSLADTAQRLTLTGTVIGTLRYMAPEQLAAGPITPRTDLYGLGVVLHEALTGRPLFPATTPLALAEAQRGGPPPMDEMDPALVSILAACLAHDPDARPIHAGALADALRDWLRGNATTAFALAGALGASADGAGAAPVTRRTPHDRAMEPAAAAETATRLRRVARSRSESPQPTRARSRSVPVAIALAAATAAILLAALLLPGIGDGEGGVGEAADEASVPTARPTRTARPAPTSRPTPDPTPRPPPAWLADLVAEVAEECGDEVASDVERRLAVMSEEEADETVDELADRCREERPGRGRGRGRGGDGGGGD